MTNQTGPYERVIMLVLILLVFAVLAILTPRLLNTFQTKIDQTVERIR